MRHKQFPAVGPGLRYGTVTQLQGKNLPFSRVAVGRPEKGQPVKLIVQVPVNASFSTQVHIQTGDADPGVIAPFANCTPNDCFAEFDLKEDILKKLREATGTGKLSFADAGGHDVAVPISFNGFAQAFDALVKK
ncbi:MAG: invasion associated locus B family protein [Xanthobacteraceae bacterium]